MNIFCSGIGGIGLSAYASLQHVQGHTVTGSDRTMTPLLTQLQEEGITVLIGQDGSGVPDSTDLFVYSEAISIDAPERLRASELGIPQMSYPEALAKLAETYAVIAVCGTHGKSSTTAMVARMLIETGLDPTVVVGTKVEELDGKNWRLGQSSIFVLEACEYRKSFHFYRPQVILMTNCDGDHYDYYKSKELYQEAFRDFIALLPSSGAVITHMSDPDCEKVVSGCGREVIDADSFPLIDMQTPGLHMKQNAQLALALGARLGISPEDAAAALAPFKGTWRRMELKGVYKKTIPVIDDYAHHPREIRATISAMKSKYPGKRLIIAFQPHTHDRTLKLYADFISAFEGADIVVVPNVYDARSDIETDRVDVPVFLQDLASGSNVQAIDGESMEQTEEILRKKILKDGDVLICMGAGDITKLAGAMAK